MAIIGLLFYPFISTVLSLLVSLFFYVLFLKPILFREDDVEPYFLWNCFPAALLWFLNAAWNWWLSSEFAPIRIDLIILLPVLLGVTIQGLVSAFKKREVKYSDQAYVKTNVQIKLSITAGALIFVLAFVGFSQKKPLLGRLLTGDLSPYADAKRDFSKLPLEVKKEYIAKLIPELKNQDWNKRLHVVYLMGDIGQPLAAPAIPALQESLKDENKDVSVAASAILGKLGVDTGQKISEALKVLEADHNRSDIVGVLGRLVEAQGVNIDAEAPKVMSVLCSIVAEPGYQDRGERDVLSHLMMRYSGDCKINPEVVSKIYEPSLESLLKMLNGSDARRRGEALSVLKWIKTPRAVAAYKEYSEKYQSDMATYYLAGKDCSNR